MRRDWESAERRIMADTVVGIFHDMAQAERAIHDLRTVGFLPSSISVRPANEPEDEAAKEEAHGAEDTFTREGATVGAIFFGTIGALMAFANEHLAPQVPVLGALPNNIFTTLLMGAAGWLAGGIIGLGVPKG